jgi:hypothetical protein
VWFRDASAPEYWERLFQAWAVLVERYCEATQGIDAPYWHRERSNVGLLAAAAWQAGLISLEEFASRRGRRSGSHGRCDLWIAPPGVHDGDAYEAKYEQVAPSWFRDPVGPALKEALGQVRALQAPYYNRRFGVVFACILIPRDEQQDPDAAIWSAIEAAKVLNPLGVAWSFPASMREHTLNSPWEGYSCPGVVLVATEANARHADAS